MDLDLLIEVNKNINSLVSNEAKRLVDDIFSRCSNHQEVRKEVECIRKEIFYRFKNQNIGELIIKAVEEELFKRIDDLLKISRQR